MEEEITITRVIKQGSTAPEWATAGTTLDVLRTFESSTFNTERLRVSPQDNFGQKSCHFNDDGNLVFKGTGTYVPHIVEVA